MKDTGLALTSENKVYLISKADPALEKWKTNIWLPTFQWGLLIKFGELSVSSSILS